jgi:hypothetical protein
LLHRIPADDRAVQLKTFFAPEKKEKKVSAEADADADVDADKAKGSKSKGKEAQPAKGNKAVVKPSSVKKSRDQNFFLEQLAPFIEMYALRLLS